jgi:hypothetical protein
MILDVMVLNQSFFPFGKIAMPPFVLHACSQLSWQT